MKKLEKYRFYVKVKESFKQMITIQEQDIKKKRSNFINSDLNDYLIDKHQIADYPKRIWFKGSRYR